MAERVRHCKIHDIDYVVRVDELGRFVDYGCSDCSPIITGAYIDGKFVSIENLQLVKNKFAEKNGSPLQPLPRKEEPIIRRVFATLPLCVRCSLPAARDSVYCPSCQALFNNVFKNASEENRWTPEELATACCPVCGGFKKKVKLWTREEVCFNCGYVVGPDWFSKGLFHVEVPTINKEFLLSNRDFEQVTGEKRVSPRAPLPKRLWVELKRRFTVWRVTRNWCRFWQDCRHFTFSKHQYCTIGGDNHCGKYKDRAYGPVQGLKSSKKNLTAHKK